MLHWLCVAVLMYYFQTPLGRKQSQTLVCFRYTAQRHYNTVHVLAFIKRLVYAQHTLTYVALLSVTCPLTSRLALTALSQLTKACLTGLSYFTRGVELHAGVDLRNYSMHFYYIFRLPDVWIIAERKIYASGFLLRVDNLVLFTPVQKLLN